MAIYQIYFSSNDMQADEFFIILETTSIAEAERNGKEIFEDIPSIQFKRVVALQGQEGLVKVAVMIWNRKYSLDKKIEKLARALASSLAEKLDKEKQWFFIAIDTIDDDIVNVVTTVGPVAPYESLDAQIDIFKQSVSLEGELRVSTMPITTDECILYMAKNCVERATTEEDFVGKAIEAYTQLSKQN